MIRTATIDDVYRIAEIHVMGWRFAYRNIISEDYLYKTMHISKMFSPMKNVNKLTVLPVRKLMDIMTITS